MLKQAVQRCDLGLMPECSPGTIVFRSNPPPIKVLDENHAVAVCFTPRTRCELLCGFLTPEDGER